jgi:CRP/FNR family cyclic AMP-dependent transcriptional regulator
MSASAPRPAETAIEPLSGPFARLAPLGRRQRFRAGAVIIQEGDRGDSLFILLSGRVRTFVENEDGRELTLGFYSAGDCLGEMALDGGPRSASVIAEEATVCSVIDRATLTAFIAEHPDFAFVLLARVIHRARLATETARGLALLDVYGRLTRLLDSIAVPGPDGTRALAEPMTHQTIASIVGASREMVSRIMKDLETGGYVRREGRRYVILRDLPAHW